MRNAFSSVIYIEFESLENIDIRLSFSSNWPTVPAFNENGSERD